MQNITINENAFWGNIDIPLKYTDVYLKSPGGLL